jgi:hypothetical protein
MSEREERFDAAASPPVSSERAEAKVHLIAVVHD